MIAKLFITFALLMLTFSGCNKKSDESMNGTKESRSESQKSQESPQHKEADKVSQKKSKNVLMMVGSDGKKYELMADYRGLVFKGYEGKILILDFFATWCPPCRVEIPHLVALQKKYKDKIQVFSILMEENKENEELSDFIDEFDINYPVLNSKENFFLSQALGGIKSLPTVVVYDKSGEYFTHFLGAVPEEMLDATIQKALKK